MRKILFLAVLILCLFAVSCSQPNIYMPDPDVWQVGNQKFDKFSDAVKALAGESRAVSPNDRITLLRDISGNERGEVIRIPESFDGRDVTIDFNGHEYWFAENSSEFFRVEGGREVEIINGKTVIPESAQQGPAMVITSDKALVNNHILEDRRIKGSFLSANGAEIELRSQSFHGNIVLNGNSKLSVTGATVESAGITQTDSVVHVGGGTLRASSLSLQGVSKFNVSGSSSDVRLEATVMSASSSMTVTGGSVEYVSSIYKADSAVFTITGGRISNPHQIDVTVLAAIALGGQEENVEHTLIHDPYCIEGHDATCTEDGVATYWACRLCDYLFSDAECLHVIEAPVVLPALGHDMTEAWGMTDYSHFHQCQRCGIRPDEEEHEWSDVVDDKQHCLVCGFEIDVNVHHHRFPVDPDRKDWQFDSEGHWLECSCGLEKDHEEHVFGDWYFDPEDNLLLRDCETCGYTELQVELEDRVIQVDFGVLILPDHSCTYGKLESDTKGMSHTVWFIPYGNTNPDYTISCWYKVGIEKTFLQADEDGRFRFECGERCTVYLQVASPGGTITKTRALSPR